MLTERDKAGKLVDNIKDAVRLDENMFHILVQHLQESGPFYKSTVERLSKELIDLKMIDLKRKDDQERNSG